MIGDGPPVCLQSTPQRYTYGQHKDLKRHAHGRCAHGRLGQNLLMTSWKAAGASCSCTSPCLQSRRRDVSIIPCEAIRTPSTLLPIFMTCCLSSYVQRLIGILAYLQQEGWQVLYPLSCLEQMCSACTVSCNPVLSQHQGQSLSHIHLDSVSHEPQHASKRRDPSAPSLHLPVKSCFQIPSSLGT